jgi:hypothetical protein
MNVLLTTVYVNTLFGYQTRSISISTEYFARTRSNVATSAASAQGKKRLQKLFGAQTKTVHTFLPNIGAARVGISIRIGDIRSAGPKFDHKETWMAENVNLVRTIAWHLCLIALGSIDVGEIPKPPSCSRDVEGFISRYWEG